MSTDIRRSLAFERINRREDQILYSSERAQEDTFNWVLGQDHPDGKNSAPTSDPDKGSFCRWLHGNDKLFWVCGKAASGKSTLMRKICHDSRLQYHLNRWTPKGTVTITKIFFTSEGSELQRSQEGLLRSLLYQALADSTLAMEVLNPYLNKTADHQGKFPWTLAELCAAFDHLVKSTSTTHRLFLFCGRSRRIQCGHDDGCIPNGVLS
jgi:hypothetical protein